MKRELSQTLDERISPFMDELGFKFRKSKRDYRRSSGEAIQVVITDVLAYPGGSYRIASHCALTFPRLVDACFEHHAYGQAQGRSDFQMVTLNCDEIYRSEISANLTFSADAPTSAIHNLEIGIQEDVLPFLDKYSDLPTLIENLDDPNWRNRITSDPLARATVRLTYHALEQDRTAFDTAVDDLRKYLGTPQGTVHAGVMEALVSGLADAHLNKAQQGVAPNA
jgi:hypothetical protein